jgi:peptide deformylase
MELNLVKYPNSVLKQKAEPVTEFGEDLKKVAHFMSRLMYEFKGIGLAANQVGLLKRIIVVHNKFGGPMSNRVFINPEIIGSEGEFIYKEGCLSHPGIYIDIKRPKKIQFKYQDTDGNFHTDCSTSKDDNILGVVIQHEIDHLNGINLPDHMTPGQKLMNDKKLMKLEKEFRKGR